MIEDFVYVFGRLGCIILLLFACSFQALGSWRGSFCSLCYGGCVAGWRLADLMISVAFYGLGVAALIAGFDGLLRSQVLVP